LRNLRPQTRSASPRTRCRRFAWRTCACARPRCAPWAAGGRGARRFPARAARAAHDAGKCAWCCTCRKSRARITRAGAATWPARRRRACGCSGAPAATPRATAQRRATGRPGARATRARAEAPASARPTGVPAQTPRVERLAISLRQRLCMQAHRVCEVCGGKSMAVSGAGDGYRPVLPMHCPAGLDSACLQLQTMRLLCGTLRTCGVHFAEQKRQSLF